MSAFVLNGHEVYDAKEVKELDPGFFFGCSVSIRNIVEIHGIPEKDVFYGIKTKTGWNVSSAAIRRASLLLSKSWVDSHVPKFAEAGTVATPSITQKYLTAPDILELTDAEKLHDDEGNIYNIEVRGKRHVNKCYFRASDVEALLEMKNINSTLYEATSSFTLNKDYVTFIVQQVSILSKKIDKHPHIFLTYSGFVRLLMVRKHPIADKFQKWAAETLFTASLGTSDAKKALAGKLLGLELADIKAFLSIDTGIMPVIYLFSIGRIGDLRKSMKIDTSHEFSDNGIVAKFGYTTDLKTRAEEHMRTFEKFEGAKVMLRCFSRIEPSCLSKAERDLREFFTRQECLVTDNKKYKELVVLSDKFAKVGVVDKYKSLGSIYVGRLAEIEKLEIKVEERDKMLVEKDLRISEKNELIAEKNSSLILHADLLKEKEGKISELTKIIEEKDKALKRLSIKLYS